MTESLLVKHNPPEELVPVAEKWIAMNRSFYLGPENIFSFRDTLMNYNGAENIAREYGSWFLRSADMISPCYQLSSEDITELAIAFSHNVKPTTCLNYVGTKCNSRCKMCYYHGEGNEEFWRKHPELNVELDLDQLRERIDQIANMGVKKVWLESFGDMFAYRHWKEYISYTIKKGLHASFNTNGIRLTDENCRFLADQENLSISISLHATTQETHSAITGITNPKAFATAVNGALLLKNKYNVKVAVGSCWSDINHHELGPFLDLWLSRHFYVQVIKVHNKNRRGYSDASIDLPFGSCAHTFSEKFYITNDGAISPCPAYHLHCAERDNLPKWYVSDKGEKTMEEIHNSKMNLPYWRELCRNCTNFTHIASQKVPITLHGHEGIQYGAHFIGFSPVNHSSSKKTIKKTLKAITPPIMVDSIRKIVHTIKPVKKK